MSLCVVKAPKEIEIITLCITAPILNVSSFHLYLHSDLWYFRKGHEQRTNNSDKICGVYSWADPLQSYRTWTGSKKQGDWALGIISVPRTFGGATGTSGVKRIWELLFLPRAPLCLPTAHVAAEVSLPITNLASGILSLPCWQQLPPDLSRLFCLHCITSAAPRDHGSHSISSAFQRWWAQKMCCL